MSIARCDTCNRPLQNGNRSGRCSRCRRCCYVCDRMIRVGEGLICPDCRPTVARIGEAHARTPAPVLPPAGHAERIARYIELAKRQEPLSAA